jgi:hypothetical protein
MGLGCEEQLEVGWIEVGIQRATTDEERCDANEADMHETDMQSHAASRCEAWQRLLPPNKSVAHGEEELQDQVEAEPQPRRRSPVPTNFGERPPLGVAKREELGSTALFEANGRKGSEGDRSKDDPQRCPRAFAPEHPPSPIPRTVPWQPKHLLLHELSLRVRGLWVRHTCIGRPITFLTTLLRTPSIHMPPACRTIPRRAHCAAGPQMLCAALWTNQRTRM